MIATASNPRVAHPMTPVLGHVRQRWMETDDTFTLELDVERSAPFSFRPGQFNMLYVFGVGEIPISISGNPDTPEVLTHTTREVGIVTRAMRQLEVGDVLGVRGPFGSAWPAEAAEERDVVVIAGGIGLAPLRPVLYHLVAHRERYRRVVLLYGARTPEDILYQDEVREWSSYLDVEVHVTVDRATRRWHGNVGVITTLIPRAPFDPKNALAMICGPEVMMHFTVQELHRRGVRSDQIYVSMERNMQCALGLCGHCQYGPSFVCKDGPVYRFDAIEPLFSVREL
ncbi:MAG: Ni/Fe hydrogenase subunit gamma [Bacteroidetes bacterium]|jgi:NAD(P)H-flavin reductase|nr:Ni/Fe hydrogenase subunit gamma [Bacteroidota bacterium]